MDEPTREAAQRVQQCIEVGDRFGVWVMAAGDGESGYCFRIGTVDGQEFIVELRPCEEETPR